MALAASSPAIAVARVQRKRYLTPLLLAVLYLLALVARYPLLKHVTLDSKNYLIPWYNYIVKHGGYRALGQAFTNYTPPYTYLLVLVTYLGGWAPKLAAIKAISIIFDGVGAFVMYKLVRLKYPTGPLPLLAFAAVLFAPTVIVNGAYWGQCDIIYTTCLLASILFACLERPLLVVLLFALAFALKAQAIFFVPFILMLALKRRIPWHYLLFVPLVYLLLALPCLLLGRSLLGIVTIYAQQGDTYKELTMNAPNMYVFISNYYYSQVVPLGLAATLLVGLALAALPLLSRAPLDRRRLLQAAALSVALMPFVLPKMHDRYFFPADMISIGLAFFCPELWFVPILLQCSSLTAYMPFLLGTSKQPVRVGAWINSCVVAVLLIQYLRGWFSPPPFKRVAISRTTGE
ncbi:MAG: hypothetical protein H0X37_24565 [Herpetosiphonaceae bacterium]|nr:hypothetical protein [Herpetosiphonaceae bacterium]